MSGQGRFRLLVVVAVGALAAGGCVGAQSRADLDEMVRSRGGGISAGLVADAIDAVGDEQGVTTVGLLNVTVQNYRVTLQARVPTQPQEYDVYTYGTSGLYGGNGLSGPHPGSRSSSGRPVEARVFTTDALDVNALDAMLDQAIADAGFADAYADRLVIDRPPPDGAVTITIRVTNDRQTTDFVFGADGTLVEVEPA